MTKVVDKVKDEKQDEQKKDGGGGDGGGGGGGGGKKKCGKNIIGKVVCFIKKVAKKVGKHLKKMRL